MLYFILKVHERADDMVYKCIGCGIEWGEGNPEVEGYSHGSCEKCLKNALIPTYRRRQAKEGYHDCFARAVRRCAHIDCKYHDLCCAGVSDL